jgi:SAM-dependent methyltransferase
MEQVTPIYNWAISKFKECNLVGSEYLGYEYEGGTTVKGIRHEDVENLSFSDSQLDLIVSNDVFEHVPHPAKAFAECARVLKSGGVMLATIPFHSGMDKSVIRARLDSGQVMHLLPEAYHGNPVSADGSLVFTDFGWDILELMKVAGFSDVNVDAYISSEFGHLGGGQLVFRCIKVPQKPKKVQAKEKKPVPQKPKKVQAKEKKPVPQKPKKVQAKEKKPMY